MNIDEIAVTTLEGQETTMATWSGKARLIVNVASRCGLAPQYEGLEELHERYADRGLAVLGFPSNQFFQELSNADAIAEFCSMTYGVRFPMFAKVKVNGKSAHPLFATLTSTPDVTGHTGRVRWNFEKFLVTPGGELYRFAPTVVPTAPEVVDAVEASLPEA